MGSLSCRNLSVEVGLRCRLHRAVDIKLDNGLDGTTTLQIQCRLAGTADFFNEMPSGRYFNFATIVPSGLHFSHCIMKKNAASAGVIFLI